MAYSSFSRRVTAKGKTLSKISRDGGRSYTEEIKNPPKSWENSRETPTVYRLEFSESDTPDKLIMISGNPIWGREKSRGGFDCSLSSDEGKTWSEYESFFTGKGRGYALSDSGTQLADKTSRKRKIRR